MLAVNISAMKTHSRVVWQLIKTDLAAFKNNMVDSAIDTAVYITLIVSSMTYVMPLLGTTADYGPFTAIAAIPSACIFEMYPLAVGLVGDIRGEKLISYRLTLPLPTSLVFVAKGLACAIRVSINALVSVIVGISILMAGGRFALTFISPVKFLLMCAAIVLFTGFFAIFTVSLVKNMDRIGSVWTRVLYPLWFLGGSTFSWKIMSTFSPTVGFISLVNPILYIMEGMHATMLNPADYLNFWLCLGMTLLFTIFFGYVGIKRLKRQLDWV
jgi:ABC-2 type transport system permease protein